MKNSLAQDADRHNGVWTRAFSSNFLPSLSSRMIRSSTPRQQPYSRRYRRPGDEAQPITVLISIDGRPYCSTVHALAAIVGADAKANRMRDEPRPVHRELKLSRQLTYFCATAESSLSGT